MAGLTLLLETQKSRVSKRSIGSGTPQILSKADMCRATGRCHGAAAGSGFLEACYLCRKRLSPDKDIYMYRGDRAFCSVECRLRQIGMDEESVRRDQCGLVASGAAASTSTAASAPSSSSPARPRKSVVAKARPGVPAGFAY